MLPPKNESSEKKSPKSTFDSLVDAYRQMGPYLNIGYFFVVAVVLTTLLGWYLDKKFQTDPWLTILGAFLGISAGFYNFFKTVSGNQSKK